MRYALTLEHDLKPPKTLRGEATDVEIAFRHALREAERLYPSFPWTSICFTFEKPRQMRASRAPKVAAGHSESEPPHE